MMPTDRGDYELIDTDSADVVGFYDSAAAALRDVAQTVELYGPEAPEVLSLALIRLDVPAEQGNLGAGAALVKRAREFSWGSEAVAG